jgi:hypothetical protein
MINDHGHGHATWTPKPEPESRIWQVAAKIGENEHGSYYNMKHSTISTGLDWIGRIRLDLTGFDWI